MNELVFKRNDQVVTSSRNVARDFGKEHFNVVRDIEGILKNEDTQQMFYKTTYIHPQNKQEYKEYLMNRDGFTLLVMGFTGKKAMQFKLKYIEAFNEMEKQQPKVLTEKEQLMASMKLTIEANEKLESHNERIANLEENMRIDSAQEFHLNRIGKKTVIKALGGYNSPAYKEMSNKVFARFWRDFKQHFIIPRYGDLPKKKFEEGVSFIKAWQPDTSTRLEIESLNKQQSFELERKVL